MPRLGAQLREPVNDGPSPAATSRRASDWGVAVAIAFSIVICLVAFVWIFIALDPILSDFTGSDMIVTPELADPATTPSDGTEVGPP
ncbi:MAG: hypothetical protein M3439_06895 [Chloroflexota bacterium]|nr:hypothetical protein [Chloroflexota bacterium]